MALSTPLVVTVPPQKASVVPYAAPRDQHVLIRVQASRPIRVRLVVHDNRSVLTTSISARFNFAFLFPPEAAHQLWQLELANFDTEIAATAECEVLLQRLLWGIG